jgi:ribosomal protein S14
MFLKQLNKDKVRRKLNTIFEIKLLVLKHIMCSSNTCHLPLKVVVGVLSLIFKANKDCFFNRSNNICILTGRQSGVYKILKISRIEIRDSKHDTYGLRKSS